MISFKQLGTVGRLGNQFFQIASTCGIAYKLGTTAGFPPWKYNKYFKNKIPRCYKQMPKIYEPCFHYSDEWFQDNKDYGQWLQSEKYFESKEAVKKIFEFEPTFLALIQAKYKTENSIAISIRRGDFVGNPNYELIPIKYYIGALLKFDYKNYNLLFFSDDLSYCRTHFGCLPNAKFIDAEPIEQIALMSLCENHIVSNSTFSWWGAYLSNSKRIIRPAYNFSESYKQKGNDDKDYWPEDWEVFDHKDYQIPLDATFIIPVQIDHTDRTENLNLVLNYLSDFDTNIIIGENKTRTIPLACKFSYDKFHRTKMINEMVKKSHTDIIINYDADVIVPPMQMIMAVDAIKNGSDMVYPYDGRFARVPRRYYADTLKYDIGITSRVTFNGMRDHDLKSLGGAVVVNKKAFFEAGGENENYVSYGNEDVERFQRFKRLGYKLERIPGVLYHFDHHIGIDSYVYHEDYTNNQKEFERISNMTDEELKEKKWFL